MAPSIPLLLGDGRKQPGHLEGPLRRPSVATPRWPPGEDLPLTYRWVKGMVSNLEYLLAVNAAAGRLVGDRSCHPIVPWVCDFARKMTAEEEDGGARGAENEQEGRGGEGWRDLTKTKFRLKKGDAQVISLFFFALWVAWKPQRRGMPKGHVMRRSSIGHDDWANISHYGKHSVLHLCAYKSTVKVCGT